MTTQTLNLIDALDQMAQSIPVLLDLDVAGVAVTLRHPSGLTIADIWITHEGGELLAYCYTQESLLNGDGEPEIITLARDVSRLLVKPLDELDGYVSEVTDGDDEEPEDDLT